VAGHVVVLALAVTMVLLGRWQLDVSDSKHFALQNFGYALQWWAFAAFSVLMWGRILRDVATHRGAGSPSPLSGGAAVPDPGPVAYRRYVMPQSADGPAPAVDAEHAAYNDYLARLAAKATPRRGSERKAR
jgi:DNA-binding transcriptional regulator of glucitol operon